MKEEEDVGPEAPTVNLQKFEYVNVGQTQGRREKKPFLVRCITPIKCSSMSFYPTSFEQPGKVKKWKSAWNIFLRITYAAFMTV